MNFLQNAWNAAKSYASDLLKTSTSSQNASYVNQLANVSSNFPQSLPSIPQVNTSPKVFNEPVPPPRNASYSSVQSQNLVGEMSYVGGGQGFAMPQGATPVMRSSTAFVGPVQTMSYAGGGQAQQQQSSAYQPGGALYAAPFGGFSASDRGTGTVSGSQGAQGTQTQSFTQPMGGGGGGGSTGQGGTTGMTEPGRFTGFSSGASGAATGGTALGGTADITQENKKQGSQPAPTIMLANPYTLPQGFAPTTTPQGGTAYKSPEGYTYIPSGTNQLQLAPNTLPGGSSLVNGQYFDNQGQVQVQPTGPASLHGPTSSSFQAGTPNTVNMAATDAATKAVTELLARPGVALSAKEFTDSYNTLYQKYYAENQSKNPVPQTPVVDTPDQQQFLNALAPDQQGYVKQQMDTMRTQLGLPTLETKKVDLQNQLNALNTTFQEIQKDIKENPELPKGLIARRLSEFASKNAINIQNLTGQLDIVQQQIQDANTSLNQQFQISTYEQGYAQQRQQNAMAQLKMFIDSGAIAGFDANTIAKYAQATGMSTEALNTIKGLTLKGDVKVVEAADGSWYKQTIGKNGDVKMERVTGPISKPGVTDGGLTPGQTQTTINQLTSQFKAEPIVQNFNVVAEGYNFAQNLAGKDKLTSADNQGLIYAFAKIMDPNSVVREGEYATVQKYAQSWAESFGFNAKRVLANTEFLSKEAVTNMVGTIGTKYQSSLQNYTNVKNEYNRRIEEAKSGSVGGSITDYGGAYSGTGGGADKSTINSDIQKAIKDTTNYPTRESLISALVQEYGISQDEAAQKVYGIWTDNTKR